MPPAYTMRFRLTVRKNGTFLRREASMPPLQCFCNVPKTARQTPICRSAGFLRDGQLSIVNSVSGALAQEARGISSVCSRKVLGATPSIWLDRAQ